MRIALGMASLLLVAGGAVACGGDDSGGKAADKGASQKDFCDAFQGFYDDLQGLTGTEKNLGEILKKAAKQIEDVGTPDNIPADAKDGLQLTLDAIDELPDDATADDLTNMDSKFSDADQKKVDAFDTYLGKECPNVGDNSDGGETDSGGASSRPSGGS
jgi:hypothetical protein